MTIETYFCGYAYKEKCLYIGMPKKEYSKLVKILGNERFSIKNYGAYPTKNYKLCDKNSGAQMITLKFELEKEEDLHAYVFDMDSVHSKLRYIDMN